MRFSAISNPSVSILEEKLKTTASSPIDSFDPPNAERMKIFVHLLNEGTEVSRPTEAISIGNALFKILATQDYDPVDEVWEFPPGTIVPCKVLHGDCGE